MPIKPLARPLTLDDLKVGEFYQAFEYTPIVEVDLEGISMLRFFTTFNPNDERNSPTPRHPAPVPLTTLYLSRYTTGKAAIVGFWAAELDVKDLDGLVGHCVELGSVTTETMPLALFMGGQRLQDLESYRRQSIPTPALVFYFAGYCVEPEGRRVLKLSELINLAPVLNAPVEEQTE